MDGAADGGSDGRRFLDAMSDQSQRAHAFNRRMSWFRMRSRLVDLPVPPEVVVLSDADRSVIDVTTSAETVIPNQRS